MSVIVACRAADGTVVFGAERQVTAGDERRQMKKLCFHPFLRGKALLGMAASNVNLGFSRKVDLFAALHGLDLEEDPVEGLQRRMDRISHDAPNQVEILCAIASDSLMPPRLIGVSETTVCDLSDSKLCGVGSGDGAAIGLLKQLEKRHETLRDTQMAVCASVWLAKQTDPLCGGLTDIWWLGPGLSIGEVEEEQVRSWEAYFGSSLPRVLRQWTDAAP